MQAAATLENVNALLKPQTLVVATDLMDTERLRPHALAQAKRIGANVILVHAVPWSTAEFLGLSPADTENQAEEQARRALSAFAGELEKHGIRCSIVVSRGDASTAVLDEVQRSHATRLLISSHRHGYDGPALLGTIANALLLESKVPVFVVPRNDSDPAHAAPCRLLCPMSLSQESQQIARFALQLDGAHATDLTLLHVMNEWVLEGAYVHQQAAGVHQLMDAVAASAARRQTVHTLVKAGYPASVILKVAAEAKADWIVMGIEHDFPWWSTQNDTAYQVIAQAAVPVLVVRARMLPTAA